MALSGKERSARYRQNRRADPDGEVQDIGAESLWAEVRIMRLENRERWLEVRSELRELRAFLASSVLQIVAQRDATERHKVTKRDATERNETATERQGSNSTHLGILGGVRGGLSLDLRSPSSLANIEKKEEKKPRDQDLEAESASANGTDKKRDEIETSVTERDGSSRDESVTMRVTSTQRLSNGTAVPGAFSHAAAPGSEVQDLFEKLREKSRARDTEPATPLLAANLPLEDQNLVLDEAERQRQLATASRWED